MKITILIFIMSVVLGFTVKSQNTSLEFDSVKFNRDLELAGWLSDYEYHTQLAVDKLGRQLENSGADWFSFSENNVWYTICGKRMENNFLIFKNILTDSLENVVNFSGAFDTTKVNACGLAISKAETHFQSIRDTMEIYFNSFVCVNPDQTISVWFFPALQPSGQAIYGCEWEFIFDKRAANMIYQKSFVSTIAGVWIGKPRELWLNYRTSISPTLGSLFFVVSFREYFTRISINTQTCTSTISKDQSGNYLWKHKIK